MPDASTIDPRPSYAAALANTAQEMGLNSIEACALLAEAIRILDSQITTNGRLNPTAEIATALRDIWRAPIGDYGTVRDAYQVIEREADRGVYLTIYEEEAEQDAQADMRFYRRGRV